MLITWHPRRWWNFCMPEDEKKKRNRTDFYSVKLLMPISINETFMPHKDLIWFTRLYEYLVILIQKIIHEDLIKFKNLFEF